MAVKRPDPLPPDFVRSISERAASIGIGDKTLRRLISAGEGPPVLRLSRKRLGIRDSAWEKWLTSREMQPGNGERQSERPAA